MRLRPFIVSVLVVVCTYTGLFISIRHTRCATPLALRDMDFALRFFFIVLVNCLCWAPVYVLRLMVLLKYHVPGNLFISLKLRSAPSVVVSAH